MKADSERWQTITESQFPWEREALDYVRDGLPGEAPFLAWSNFEFMTQHGQIYEVDLMVLTRNGFHLIEIKSWRGRVSGDPHEWELELDGNKSYVDGPIVLANRKAKLLASLLRSTRAARDRRGKIPFLEAAIFLSADKVQLDLDERAQHHVYVRDRKNRPGIKKMLTAAPARHGTRARMDRSVEVVVRQAMKEAGIRERRRRPQVGDYQLGELLFEGPGYQDFAGTHSSLKGAKRRVRVYGITKKGAGPSKTTVRRAAKREYQILDGVRHPGILRPTEYSESECGPALLFEVPDDAVRLDHFLAKQGHQLTVGQKLGLMRQLAEALRHAHAQQLVHRALSPESVLVLQPSSDDPRLQIFNWQTAAREIARESGGSDGGSRALTLTRHLDDLISPRAKVYLAPEAFAIAEPIGEALDVFSLGTIAYHVFSNRPPASSPANMQSLLAEQKSLRLSADLDGACQALVDLVQYSTQVSVEWRLPSAADFLEHLELVEDELTSPHDDAVENPHEAGKGDKLDGGYIVEKRLGSGASSVVFRVRYLTEQGERTAVLKLARGPEQNDRLGQEAQVLRSLDHQYIVGLIDKVEISGCVGLLLSSAGDKTLRHRLRRDGALTVENLQRFGDDLLQVVKYLEDQGIPHRDLKPENMGITPVGRGDARHLVLFDFSLSRVAAERIEAGTEGYRDPFLALRPHKRWDVQAEHFSAALVLYEMAAGRLPAWGDGRSDPLLLDDEASIDAELFFDGLRQPLHEFFERALRRDAAERFDNADQMLLAWREVFQRAETTSDHATEDVDFDALAAELTLDTPVVTLPLRGQAQGLLARENVFTVGDLLNLPRRRLIVLRGVGYRTRQELLRLLTALDEHLPDDARQVVTEHGERAPGTVEALAQKLLVTRVRRADTEEGHAVRMLLGSEETPDVELPGWPGQTEIAAALRATRARVGTHIEKARKWWRRLLELTDTRDQIAALLDDAQRVLAQSEIVDLLITLLGTERPDEAPAAALAVLRAATEVEAACDAPRWTEHRGRIAMLFVARGSGGARLASYADELGLRAETVAAEEPLPSPGSVENALRAVPLPAGLDRLGHERLVRLAAATAPDAAASPRLEIYPVGMAADRALRLARGAIAGERRLTPDQLRDRVRTRYPEAQPLPDRPKLDALLATEGLEFAWCEPTEEEPVGHYQYRSGGSLDLSSRRSTMTRFHTAHEPLQQVPADVAEAREFTRRLRKARKQGTFRVWCVAPERLARAETELVRRHPELQVVRLDGLLLTELERVCERRGVSWDVVVQADTEGPQGAHWGNVQQIAADAGKAMIADLLSREGDVLLTHPGLLVRYGQLGVLERLRDEVGAKTSESRLPLHGAWVLMAVPEHYDRPMLDGQVFPVISAAQWGRVPYAWIVNADGGGLAAAAAFAQGGEL